MFIQTESTPNPATLKFLPGKVVMEKGTADFRPPRSGRLRRCTAPVRHSGVTGVYFGYDFVTVSKEAQNGST